VARANLREWRIFLDYSWTIFAKRPGCGGRIYSSEGMRVERPKKMSGAMRFWAATCLIVWLLGFSVAIIAQVCSCCDPIQKSRAGCSDKAMTCCGSRSHHGGCGNEHTGKSGCCDKHQPKQTCASESGCSMSALELKPALPFALCDGLFLSLPTPPKSLPALRLAAPVNPILCSSPHHLEQVIPPELRLGSALWSHAPPIRVA
jgi:hypothetical protein